MNAKRTFATARRFLTQLRHDPRTIALILFVPSLLIVILYYVFNGKTTAFNLLAPNVLGIFPFTVMFVVTSIAMLRERTTGTLERLMAGPVAKLDILLGYAVAFSILAVAQSCLASWVTLGVFQVPIAGGALKILVVAWLAGLLGMALGLALSSLARTEFQAVQFLPAVVLPQLLVCGLFVARDSMVSWLQTISNYLPLTYVVEAMKQVQLHNSWTDDLSRYLLVISAFVIAALVVGAATLRRSR